MRRRLEYFKEAIGRPVVKWLSVLWVSIGVWDTFAAQLLPPRWEAEFPNLFQIVSAMSGYWPWWVWVIGTLLLMLILAIEHAVRQQPKGNLDGPVYWSLAQTLSWIAFGEPMTAGQLEHGFIAKNTESYPEDEKRHFDKAESELLEQLRARKLIALGKNDGRGMHTEIPNTYFLSNVGARLFDDSIDLNGANLDNILTWDGPKWTDVKLDRASVQRIWPVALKDSEDGLAIYERHADKCHRTMDLHANSRTYICEIEVRNLSKTKQARDVLVEISEIDGKLLLDLPQTLFPKNETINAGTSKVWEVVRGSHAALGEEVNLYLNIEYRGERYRLIGNRPYKMKFRVSGASIGPETRQFRLDFDESKRPMLYPIDE